MRRSLRVLAASLRVSTLLVAQYRTDFLVEGALEVCWAATAIVPLLVLYRDRPSIAGFSFGESLLVTGFFTLLSGVLQGAVSPSMTAAVEHIRKGTLDFVLLKPADAQLLISTARFAPWRSVNVLTASALFAIGFRRIGHAPSLAGVGLAALLAIGSVVILYSLWVLAVSASFYAVKMDNLAFFFESVFDAARWPSTVFRGVWRLIFTFVIPLGVMTTFPAEALLGRLDPTPAALALGVAALLFAGSRVAFTRAIRGYSSASS